MVKQNFYSWNCIHTVIWIKTGFLNTGKHTLRNVEVAYLVLNETNFWDDNNF